MYVVRQDRLAELMLSLDGLVEGGRQTSAVECGRQFASHLSNVRASSCLIHPQLQPVVIRIKIISLLPGHISNEEGRTLAENAEAPIELVGLTFAYLAMALTVPTMSVADAL